MNLSDLRPDHNPAWPATPADTSAEAPEDARWRDLVMQLSVEVAGPLTAALERVHALVRTGRIDRDGLRALRIEVEQARAAGLVGQQLARFASGRLRQTHERLPLTRALKDVLAQRAHDLDARGVKLRQVLKPAEVLVDATLLSGLLNTLLDWSLANALSGIELRIDTRPWPVHARLHARFAYRGADRLDDEAVASAVTGSLDSLAWRLLEQIVWTMGLTIERRDEGAMTQVSIEFPRTVNDALEGVSSMELDAGFAPSTTSKPLAGNHVLIVGARRDLRAQVHEAIRHMGLIIDVVGSVDEAAAFCREGLPHAIVFESALGGERLTQLRDEISADAPEFVFIEIVEEGNQFEVSSFSGAGVARVGRAAIAEALPSALMVELSKSL